MKLDRIESSKILPNINSYIIKHEKGGMAIRNVYHYMIELTFQCCICAANKHTNLMLVVASDREQDLSDTDTGTGSMGLAESTSHSSLEPEQLQKLQFYNFKGVQNNWK